MNTELTIKEVIQLTSSSYQKEMERFDKLFDLKYIRSQGEAVLRIEKYFDPDTGKFEADEIEPLITIVKNHLETTKRKKIDYKHIYPTELLNERERRIILLLDTLNDLLKLFISFGYIPMVMRDK